MFEVSRLSPGYSFHIAAHSEGQKTPQPTEKTKNQKNLKPKRNKKNPQTNSQTSKLTKKTPTKQNSMVLGESRYSSYLKAALPDRFSWSKGSASCFLSAWQASGAKSPSLLFCLFPLGGSDSWRWMESLISLLQNSRSSASRIHGNGTCCLPVRNSPVQGVCHLVL